MGKNRYLINIIFILFVLISVFAIYSDISNITKKISNISQVDIKFNKILLLREIIQELQRERGLTNIYYSKKVEKTFQLLQKQRATMQDLLSHSNNEQLIKEINTLRLRINKNTITASETFDSYTKLILNMLIETKKLLLFTTDQGIKNHLLIYQKTNFVQEYLGQLRAEIGSILETRGINHKQYLSIIKLQTLVNNYILQTKENILLTKVVVTSPIKKKCFRETNILIEQIVHQELQQINISSIEWFNLSTCAIDSIATTMTEYLQHVKEEIDRKLLEKKSKLYFHIVFWVLAILISLLLSLILYKTNRKMLTKQKLLEDYKKAIDNSTIVSKTDKRGIITYANQAFCNISGYTVEELIGKPHNIVRDPSVPKEAFSELWSTIKSGKTWSEQLSNRAKDKSTYWVNATISPIYDNDNNLVEYIAIRHDITEIIELSKEIKSTQYELIYRMGESVESRSKESGHHIQRVAHYSKLLAQYYGLSNQEAETIFIASTMHDMGKIAIPDSILLKKAKLSNDEWEIMKTHSAIGYKILAGSNLPILKMAANIAYEHHEHYNGAGYPRSIKGEEISICARIVMIADVFDALISERVYKKAWPLEEVINLFKKEKGEQFDPKLTDLFLDNMDSFIKIKEEFED